MRRMLLPAGLLLATLPVSAAAAEACDVPPRFGLSPLAVAIRITACNEHRLWYRPFIDREGRAASLSVTEAENEHLADNGLIAWQRVSTYWRESGTLNALGSLPGAGSCLAPLGTRYTDSDCRAFLIDNPWSAAFISWVMVRAGVPGFNTSPRHIDYIRAAYQAGPQGVPYRLVDPATAKPAPGDLLCFLRDRSTTLSYSGLVQALGNGSVGHWKSHCEVVVSANLGGDQTLYLVGGNVMNTVAMRLLALDRTGHIQLPAARGRSSDGIDPTCTPGREDECSFNRQDWAALLQLTATAPLQAPPLPAVPVAEPAPGTP
ncbi:DUF2272 domain-containing protein [Stenotrophomonas sp. 24(2023)]|uniref:DUF2272 domain-containing protein n=1 Tax=Stenotrophomonas sp. 24(2023) TaxID=3068324 RepID=UPI0027E1B261|nr:DUF2272 domain-containing protein [Stenotrophomonas sp. 24(2023)]WMJ68592.1 DUF2272 domain-containing protein [Stenotrophomonas sp. 24(2023)]